MLFSMTTKTKRYHVKPVRFVVSKMVVVLVGIIVAKMAFFCNCSWDLIGGNRITKCFSGHEVKRFGFSAFSRTITDKLFSSFCLSPPFSGYFGGFIFLAMPKRLFVNVCLPVLFGIGIATCFTEAFMPIGSVARYVKFINIFLILAFTAYFCYDLLRHGFSLIKKLCLEPLQTQYLCGSFHYTACDKEVKHKINNIAKVKQWPK